MVEQVYSERICTGEYTEEDTFQQAQFDINNLINRLEDTIYGLESLKDIINSANLKIQELEKQLNEFKR